MEIKLHFHGNISAGFANIKYNITGIIQGNILSLNAQTNMGNFNLQGKQIA